MRNEVVIIKTGLANVASMIAGLSRIGACPTLSDDPQIISEAERVVLPGVGAFGAGMSLLKEKRLDAVLKDRISKLRPTLTICLGLQLLCESSEESPGVSGLGILPLKVKRFSDSVCVPQIGWNEVLPDSNCKLIPQAEMYFANSYCLPTAPEGWNVATANHGENFVAAIERDGVLGCQFHAELSSEAGITLLKNWFEAGY